MKKLNKALIIFIIIFTPLLSQVKRELIMPEGYTKLHILVEDIRHEVSASEIESFVKLKLRRNNIEYFSQGYHLNSPTLYININISEGNNNVYFGNIEVNFRRSSLFQVSLEDYLFKPDFNFNEYRELKGRESMIATVKDYSTIFIKTRPASQLIKEVLDGLLDEFISDYIDANNL